MDWSEELKGFEEDFLLVGKKDAETEPYSQISKVVSSPFLIYEPHMLYKVSEKLIDRLKKSSELKIGLIGYDTFLEKKNEKQETENSDVLLNRKMFLYFVPQKDIPIVHHFCTVYGSEDEFKKYDDLIFLKKPLDELKEDETNFVCKLSAGVANTLLELEKNNVHFELEDIAVSEWSKILDKINSNVSLRTDVSIAYVVLIKNFLK
ncbi:hypothetical protein DRJ22_03315 [Candidatus Woesearchaeota archaeon]|nr:MAG: hypothetical protein DRJ22_03315 [Candidatus Woesearchaeota archaeon]